MMLPTPTPPLTPRIAATSDSAALPAPSLRLPPSPASSSLFSSSSSGLRISLSPSVPRIVVTLVEPSERYMPWCPCKPSRSRYDSTHLAPPPRRRQIVGHGMPLDLEYRYPVWGQGAQRTRREQHLERIEAAESKRKEQLRLSVSKRKAVGRGEEDLQSKFRVAKLVGDFDLLRPIGRDLVAWRLLSFYSVTDIEDFAFCARFRILSRSVDWSSTRRVLREQQRQHQKRQRRTLGIFPVRVVMRGLDLLSAIHAVADDAGVPVSQLMLAIEAFATHLEPVKRVSASNLAEQKRWEDLARILLEDREYLSPNLNATLFPHQRVEFYNTIRAERREAEKKYFNVLDYEEDCCGGLFCCLPDWKGKQKLDWNLSERENARLDCMLGLQAQIAAAYPSRRWEQRPENEARRSGSTESEVKPKRKSLRISVEEEHDASLNNGEGASRRASWDSQEEREKRRKDRREFLFGKEEDEEEAEGPEEKERKRKQALDKFMAANAMCDQQYSLPTGERTD